VTSRRIYNGTVTSQLSSAGATGGLARGRRARRPPLLTEMCHSHLQPACKLPLVKTQLPKSLRPASFWIIHRLGEKDTLFRRKRGGHGRLYSVRG
jgi:hypothetical protein